MDLKTLVAESARIAREHGWDEDPKPTVGDCIALMHSELSEALEEHRKGKAPTDLYTIPASCTLTPGKPEGIPAELADVVIRIAHFCGREGIDLEAAVEAKLAYNASRPYRHGGKRL